MIVVVCSVIAEQNGKFLLVCEKKAEAKSKYGLPGGRLEPGETLVACAQRELVEETGYGAKDLRLVSITHKPTTHVGNSVVRFVYRADEVEKASEVSELQTAWLNIEEIMALSQDGRVRGSDVLDLLGSDEQGLTVSTY